MNHLGVFAKYWQAGHVKTRLAASIGHENAARLYREFVRQTLCRLERCGQTRSVWIWPPDQETAFSSRFGDSWTVCLQPEGDLGHRMCQYFQTSLRQSGTAASHCRAVLVGSDSPNLATAIVDEAFAALQDHQCVLGPSADGGYYLIGMNSLHPGLFEDISWSSARVLEQTVDRLQSLAISWHRLPVWNDVDEIDDLRALAGQLATAPCPSELDQQLLDAIHQATGPHHDRE